MNSLQFAMPLCFAAIAVLASAEPAPEIRPFVGEDFLGKIPEGVIANTLRISPDGKRIAGVIARENEKQAVFINGKVSPDYEGVISDSIHFSPDSQRIAYGAKLDGRAFVLVDGVEYPAFDACGAGFPIFDPTGKHFIYPASREGKVCVVMDGKPGEIVEAVTKTGPVFSLDGARFFYVAKDGEWSCVVVDGVAGRKYRGIDAPIFSSDGKHFAYVALTPTKAMVVVDGRETVVAEHLMRDSLAFDSPTRLHVLVLRSEGVSRVQVDLLPSFESQSTPAVNFPPP